MNPDYLEGMRAFDRGEPFDPKQRGQWRRGWERARENDASDPFLRGKDGTPLFDTVMRRSMWGPNWRDLTEDESS